VVAGWPGYEKYAEKLRKMTEAIFVKLVDLNRTCEGDLFNVLNHGDFHAKNMMFQFNEDKTIKEFIFVWNSQTLYLI
jgi:hypothetical protein